MISPSSLLRAGRGRAAGAGVPPIGDEVVGREVVVDHRELASGVALGVLELAADVADRLAFPRHLARCELPARVARNAAKRRDRAGKEIDRAARMARRARRARNAVAARAALDRRIVPMMIVALERMVAGWMAVRAARRGEHFRGLGKQGARALGAVGDARERRWRPQRLVGVTGLCGHEGEPSRNDRHPRDPHRRLLETAPPSTCGSRKCSRRPAVVGPGKKKPRRKAGADVRRTGEGGYLADTGSMREPPRGSGSPNFFHFFARRAVRAPRPRGRASRSGQPQIEPL